MQVYGALEAGGTKFICAVAESPDAPLLERVSFMTTTPAETIEQAVNFFKKYSLKALGVASFGPIDLDPASPTHGYITATPKPGWVNTDLLGPLREALNIPIGFDTDVNGAALGESRYGAARDVPSVVYFTVGTGIGGGAVVNRQPLRGLVHSEMGHIPLKRHPDDKYTGHCPYHGDCLEGMACGPAIEARWGARGETLAVDHKAWIIEAYYLAQAVTTVIYTLSPHRVILGGGIMHQKQLFPLIRKNALELLNGYITNPSTQEAMDKFVISPGLGDDAGCRGALELAKIAAG
jgi:fructokinase